jgi:hypothetical protein
MPLAVLRAIGLQARVYNDRSKTVRLAHCVTLRHAATYSKPNDGTFSTVQPALESLNIRRHQRRLSI